MERVVEISAGRDISSFLSTIILDNNSSAPYGFKMPQALQSFLGGLVTVIFAGLGASAVVADAPSWKLAHRAELTPDTTGIVVWDEQTFGLWNPGAGRVQLMAPSGELGAVVQFDRLLSPIKSQGPQFPDPLLRIGRRVYWLSRPTGTVAVFDPTGSFVELLATPASVVTSIARADDGSVEVFGFRPESLYAGAEKFSSSGRRSGFIPSWLQAQVTTLPTYLETHLARVGGSRFEVLAHFPHARVTRGDSSRVVDLLATCPTHEFRILFEQHYEKLRQTRGWPEPLGPGFDPEGLLYMAALELTELPQGVLALVNGGFLVFLPSDLAASISCFRTPTSNPTGGAVSLAWTGRRLGLVLVGPGTTPVVELWDVADHQEFSGGTLVLGER